MKQGGSSNGPYRKGHWSVEEDIRLIQFVRKYGEGRWSKLAKAAGLQRCGKSCRLRWVNYLRPDIKRGHISEEEERLIIHLHARMGNRWSLIALHLPGRSDNEIKNYWRSHIKKKLKVEDLMSNNEAQSGQIESFSTNSDGSQNVEEYNTTLIEGACYDVIGFDGCSNSMEPLQGTTSGTYQEFDGYSLQSSINNLESTITSEMILPNYEYDRASNYPNTSGLNDDEQLVRIDATDRFLTYNNTHIQEPLNVNSMFSQEINLAQVSSGQASIKIHGETWDFNASIQHTTPMYEIDHQPHAIALHDSDVAWDVESVQPIVDARNPPFSMVDNNYGFELWENDLFPNDFKYQGEQTKDT
ncbi:hypothetical protein GOP47_0006255 [Adiantum capillus-veneris]|uniref:Uncharacterized protein n=1 Tax=Adiantum capillus-veneris TaxID=13818 RepID=A0A9D4V2J0_ADICA|nr:hypothetical protein GOP47_0006255 [Adiantum capillus-veneris]